MKEQVRQECIKMADDCFKSIDEACEKVLELEKMIGDTGDIDLMIKSNDIDATKPVFNAIEIINKLHSALILNEIPVKD